MARTFLKTLLLSLLTGAPALADSAQTCRDAMGRSVSGPTIDERIRFLEGAPQICGRSLNPDDCNDSMAAMGIRLQNVKDKIGQACDAAAEAERKARAACNGAEACLASVRGVLDRAKESLASIQGELDRMAEDMRLIRDHMLATVRAYGVSRDRSPPVTAEDQSPDGARPYYRFDAISRDVMRASADSNTDLRQLRAMIERMNHKGHDQAVNSLWVVANAIEMEQFSLQQKRAIASSITGLERKGADVAGRQGSLARVPVNKSDITRAESKLAPAGRNEPPPANSSGNALGALPGLVSAAGQLAGAARSADSPASPGDLLAPNRDLASAAKLPSVDDLVRGRSEPGPAETKGSAEAAQAQGPRVSSLGRKASDFSFGSGGGARPGKPAGRSRETAETRKGASSRANLARAEGQPLGATGDPDQAPAKGGGSNPATAVPGEGGQDFNLAGGGPAAEGSFSTEATDAAEAPAGPLLAAGAEVGQAELARLLENPPVHGSPAAGELVSSSGPTLFTRVWVAHNRSLKRGLVNGPRKPL